MLVKNPLYGDVSKKSMMEMFDPFFYRYTNSVRTIEMFVESALATVSKWFAIADRFFFSLVRTYRLCVHIINLPNRLSSMPMLKIAILVVSENESKFWSRRRIRFLAIREIPHIGCFQMAVTIAVITENVCMSRRWKAGQGVYIICKQPSPRFMLLRP
jgi:hypothetical protein